MGKDRSTFLKVQREMEKKRKAEEKRKRRKKKENEEPIRTTVPVLIDPSSTEE